MAIAGRNLTRRLEDYLEAVGMLIKRDGVARVRDIAARTDVTKSSVTAALKQLAGSGLVEHDPYELVKLTPRGEVLAEQIRRRHNTLREFLVDVLSIDADRAEANACRMEHVVDDQVLRRLALLAEFIQDCPWYTDDWPDRFVAYCRQRQAAADAGGRPDGDGTSEGPE